MFYSQDSGDTWYIADDPGLDASGKDGAFAASNSSLTASGPFLLFGTGGDTIAHVYRTVTRCNPAAPASCPIAWVKTDTPLSAGTPASGAFSLAARMSTSMGGKSNVTLVAAGGTYDKPDLATSSAAVSHDGGEHWVPATTPPHGFRSAVAFDIATQIWITIGLNGTNISRDDGYNWQALKPSASDPVDADKKWNALSLPFVVGPMGRIGKLEASPLQSVK